MNKYFVLIAALLICAISVNAQQIKRPLPTKLDDFDLGIPLKEKVTTELIECSSTSNVYARINIHRNYGVPRFGIITDCSSKTLDTVWYIPNTINKPNSGAIPTPLLTDTSITVWWKEGRFTVQIMDVLTGNIILSETKKGQDATLFDGNITEIPLSDSTKIEFTGSGISPKKNNNIGETINYNHINSGLYWIYLIDDVDNVIRYMKTIRKGI